MEYPFAVVHGPGMYRDGLIEVSSLHLARKTALLTAAKRTRAYRRTMRETGRESTGYYVAVHWGRQGRTFWADTPPRTLETNV